MTRRGGPGTAPGARRRRWLALAATALAWSAHGAGAEAPPGAGEAPEAAAAADRVGFGALLPLRDGGAGAQAPIEIESDELELRAMPDEGRMLLFERNVRVRQGPFALRADVLEAYYPPQESEPSRLAARGHVRVDQPGQRAFCEEAEYERATDRLTCRGNARLERGCDVVRGDAIEFDLGADRARVIGAARVVIAPRDGGAPCPDGSPPGGEAP